MINFLKALISRRYLGWTSLPRTDTISSRKVTMVKKREREISVKGSQEIYGRQCKEVIFWSRLGELG